MIYFITIVTGIALRTLESTIGELYYSTYKDILPLIIAIPAAYLAYSFQRRNNYMQALRTLWSNTITAVAVALIYTEMQQPPSEQYYRILERLCAVIDECRGVFINVQINDNADDLFPFEPIRQIFWEVKDLGFGEAVTIEMQQYARDRIEQMWKGCKKQMLAEFDRDLPTYHQVEYVLPISPGHQEQRQRNARLRENTTE
jgi:hypothetical protein